MPVNGAGLRVVNNGNENIPRRRSEIGRGESKSKNEVIEAKIVLAGDMAVGKSSLAGRYNYNKFNDLYQNTIGGAYF